MRALTEVTDFGSNPGGLRMYKYVPDRLPAAPPLVVALHGCGQRASDYDDETGWTQFADTWGFVLLLPEQQSANNRSRCFNWFNGHRLLDWLRWFLPTEWGSDQDRDEGEALSIKQMVDYMKAVHHVDPRRVFVTGLSGGGAMASVMLATYPEVFAGGAIIAGVPYKCAVSSSEALSSCGVDTKQSGHFPTKNLSPAAWGRRVREATDYRGSWPRVSIWQGSADRTVNPADARELVEQWTDVHGLDRTRGVTDTVKGYPHTVYRREVGGDALVEYYSITGMGHGTPVDPGAGEDQCGAARNFILDVDICSSYYIAKFWGLDKIR